MLTFNKHVKCRSNILSRKGKFSENLGGVIGSHCRAAAMAAAAAAAAANTRLSRPPPQRCHHC